ADHPTQVNREARPLRLGHTSLEDDDETGSPPRSHAARYGRLDDRAHAPTLRRPRVQGSFQLAGVHLVADEGRSDRDRAVLVQLVTPVEQRLALDPEGFLVGLEPLVERLGPLRLLLRPLRLRLLYRTYPSAQESLLLWRLVLVRRLRKLDVTHAALRSRDAPIVVRHQIAGSPRGAGFRCSTATTIGSGAVATVLLHEEGVIVEPDGMRTFGHVRGLTGCDIHDPHIGRMEHPVRDPVRSVDQRALLMASSAEASTLLSEPSAFARQRSGPGAQM